MSKEQQRKAIQHILSTKIRKSTSANGAKYILFIGNENVGHASLRNEGKDVVLSHISIKHQYRGQGYGNMLLARVLEEYDKIGKALWLDADPLFNDLSEMRDPKQTFEKLVQFYESFGFQKVGKVQERKLAENEDLISKYYVRMFRPTPKLFHKITNYQNRV